MIILDTHALIWTESDQKRIPPLTLERIQREPEVGIASISLWEIAMLIQKGRIDLEMPIYDWFERIFEKPRFRLIPLSPEIAIRSGTLDMYGDPADRLIVASALVHRSPLVTADLWIQRLDFVNAVW